MRISKASTRFRSLVALGGGSATIRMLYFLFYGSGAALSTFFNVYLRQIGFSGQQIGLLAGLRPAVMLLSQPLWGVGADLWGRRRTLLFTMLLSAVITLGYTGSRTFLFFVGWTILYTLLSNPVGSLLDSLALDHISARPRIAFGQLRMWGAVGWGIVASVVGYVITGRDIRLIFVFSASLMLLGWLLAWRSPNEESSSTTYGQSWSGLRTLLRNRRLLVFLGLVTAVQIGATSIFGFYSLYLDALGASRQLIGFAFTVQGLAELPMYLLAGAIIRRFGATRTVIFAFLVYATRAFLYSIISAPLLAVAVEATHGLSFSLFLVASVAIVDREVPNQWRATGQSLFSASYFGAGSILGNLWAGYLFDRIGIQGMYRVNAGLILGVALCAALLLRGHHEAQAETP
jgi:PPP family 3-phenylpropionic acid transporter